MKQIIIVCLAVFLFPYENLFSNEKVDTIKSLTEKSYTPPPGVVIHNSPATSHKYIGSPCISVTLDGQYLASHDYFGQSDPILFIYTSSDKGNTWKQIATVDNLKWASLFNHDGKTFLMGVRPYKGHEYGDLVILQSDDNGKTWTTPTDDRNGILLKGYYHRAPVPVVTHNGKIWHALEDHGTAHGWGQFAALTMSIDANKNLLDAHNWHGSNRLKFDKEWLLNASAWLEGNIVVAKDNSVKNILRVHYSPDNKAAMVNVSENGLQVSFDPSTGFVELPGACKKFSIRYDEVEKKYWTLSNYVLEKDRGGNNERLRNTIALSYSDDLINWHIKEILLHHPDTQHHGFQYVDWLIEGEDIIAVSRTAWEDETGSADNQHNANYLTFHRFKNFRK